MSVLLLAGFLGMLETPACAQSDIAELQPVVQIREGDAWYYLKGLQEAPRDWNRADLDVSTWQKGSTGIGYGTATNNTVLEDMQGNYKKVYARTEFLIDYPELVTAMKLSVVCDGPFIAYLNGVEMLRTKTIQVSNPDQPLGVSDVEQYNVSGFKHELVPGKNILALQCDNDDIDSLSYSFIPVFEVLEKWGAQ